MINQMTRDQEMLCVSNMNGPTRKKNYMFLAERDGEHCKCCGVLSSERQLVIDHKDNNNGNNDLSNFQFLCRPCNYLKNPRRPLDLCVSECESGDLTEIQISQRKEPAFKKFVFHELNEYNEVSEYDLINDGAEDIGISPVTARRYLDKICSNRGICMRVISVNNTMIKYKPNLEER